MRYDLIKENDILISNISFGLAELLRKKEKRFSDTIILPTKNKETKFNFVQFKKKDKK